MDAEEHHATVAGTADAYATELRHTGYLIRRYTGAHERDHSSVKQVARPGECCIAPSVPSTQATRCTWSSPTGETTHWKPNSPTPASAAHSTPPPMPSTPAGAKSVPTRTPG
jgi:hypothetical protein